ncbi:MAG: SH3 domain-containing protein, partial [Synergistota bacterium]|nr:SH3 domain-containing protein [Synergistota bacterium]
EMGKESLAGYLGGSFADTLLARFDDKTGLAPGGVFASPAWADENLTLALAPLGSFLGGYGAGYMLLVETSEKPEILSKGRVLEPAPNVVFSYRNETQRLFESGRWTAVILGDGETVNVSATGDGDVRACLVGPKGVQAAAIGPQSPLGPVAEVSSSGFSSGQPASPDKADGKKAEITGSGVRLRDDHGLEGKVVGALDKGDVVEVLDKWTAPSDMAIIREDCTGMFEDRTFRFKKGMGVHLVEHEFESEEVIVGVMQNGEMVTYGLHIEFVEIPKEQTWYMVRTGKGLEGWAYGDFVKVLD